MVERWIMAALRNRTFFSLSEANASIKELLTKLNERPFKKLPGCRRSQFEELDKPALKPLPDRAYEYAQWKQVRVGINYHIEIESHRNQYHHEQETALPTSIPCLHGADEHG